MSNLNKFTIQKSFVISASAGSGKTFKLSRRYINALLGFDFFREDYGTQESYFDKLNPAKVKQIVTITYTEAAALEMRGRIFELVSKIIDQNLDSRDKDYNSIKDANDNISEEEKKYVQTTLIQALRDSSHAKISTTHAYCLDMIKANADIAKIDTRLDIIKDNEKAKELSNIIFEVLNDKKNKKIVLDIAQNISMFFINDLIKTYIKSTKFRKDYDSFSKSSITEEQYKNLIFELYPLSDIQDRIDEVKRYMLSSDIEDKRKYCDLLDKYIENFYNFKAVLWSNLSKEHELNIAFNRKPWTSHKEISDDVKAIKKLDGMIEAYSEINQDKESLFFDKIDKIKSILHQIKDKYDKRLKELKKIDFDTIITKTLEIMPKIKTDFRYIMVDEFQDTNEIQFEIVRNSMNKNTNLFVVGDSKQSIYAFQGAEIEVFNRAVYDSSLFSGKPEDMSVNFRSDGVVLQTVNTIFKELLKEDENLKIISQDFEAKPQDLVVSSKEKESLGSFRYLITSGSYVPKADDEVNELDTIAQFIDEVYHGKNSNYTHITKLIKNKEKAIAILFDGGDKMLELRVKLLKRGISSKISKSDNFYHTKEINDIFSVLKAIDILSRNPKELNNSQKYYIVGAMRSNIIRVDDNRIKYYLDTNSIDKRLLHYVEMNKDLTLSQLVKYIYDDSNIMGVYAHLDNVEQYLANLYKFLTLCREYEEGSESSLYNFLSLVENAIYFSKDKEDEAFYQSDNTKSIELCTIHSTKGLAYPLVLVANSDKGLYRQIEKDALRHNSFILNNNDNKEKKEIVGFKINKYLPLSFRVLKEIDKIKHLSEKKRLLYVALTRAEHDVVVSAYLKIKKKGEVNLREDSYLSMITKALKIEIDELYGQNPKYCITLSDEDNIDAKSRVINYTNHTLKPLEFTPVVKTTSATQSEPTVDNKASKIGTLTHKVIEKYWTNFRGNEEVILEKLGVLSKADQNNIKNSMELFYKSDVYHLLSSGVEHHFELEFQTDTKKGFIDLLYYDSNQDGWVIVDFKTGTKTADKKDKYQKQLDFYKTVMESMSYHITETKLLWL